MDRGDWSTTVTKCQTPLSNQSESESEVAQSCQTASPWTVAYHTPPSMGFSRQECWSGLLFPSPAHTQLTDPKVNKHLSLL